MFILANGPDSETEEFWSEVSRMGKELNEVIVGQHGVRGRNES